MRRMKQALKLKSCASSVMARCLLTVVSNGFKKPVFGFLSKSPHPSIFTKKVLTL